MQQAMGADDSAAEMALSALCEAYWYPIYAYIRRKGNSPQDSQDLTQSFFAWLLAKQVFAKADKTKGKLRNFLLTCAQRFLGDERDRAMAQKRGAAISRSFDAWQAEELYAAEPRDDLSPDRLFQRRWALTILNHSLSLLSEEFAARGKAELFAVLRPFLGFGPDPEKQYGEVAGTLGMPLGTLKSHVSRLRERWRELIFEQVALTLADASPEEVRGELGELLGYV